MAEEGREIPLTTAWEAPRPTMLRARCTTPPDLARGVYAIAARHDGGVDRTLRSVYVRKNFPRILCHRPPWRYTISAKTNGIRVLPTPSTAILSRPSTRATPP